MATNAALTDDNVHALLSACSRRAPTGIRNAALIAVMRSTGLRVSEALALDTSDVDLARGTVRVRNGKGGKSRTVGLGPAAAALLGRWIDTRKALGHNGHRRVFCTLDGGPMSTGYVRHMMLRLGARAGIEGRCAPHMLRHAHAVDLAQRGASAAVIRDALGHSSLAVTDRYLRDLHPHAAIEAQQGGTF